MKNKLNLHDFLLILFFPFTIFIFGPISFYYNNAVKEHLPYTLNDFIFPLLAGFFLASLLLLALYSFMSSRLKKTGGIVFCTILFSLGLGTFLEGDVLRFNYGLLDGHEIQWDQFIGRGICDSLLWLIILVGTFILLKKKTDGLAWLQKISGLVIAFEIVTLLIFSLTTKVEKPEFQLTDSKLLNYSQNQNVLILILDAFDQGTFSKVLDENPEIKTALNGFTFYPDTLGVFPHTDTAIPFILTGKAYDNSIPYMDYIDSAWQNSELVNELIKEGFDIDIYTTSQFVSQKMAGKIRNFERIKIDSLSVAEQFLHLTAYSFSPQVFKPLFWFTPSVETSSINSYIFDNNIIIRDKVRSGELSANDSQNLFEVIHLKGNHPLWNLDRNGNQGDKITGEFETAKGAIKILLEYFSALKSAGVYDNADIVVLADHGSWELKQNPLLMVKPSGDIQRFRTSFDKLSYLDNLYPTLLALVSKDTSIKNSIYNLPDNVKENTRTFFYYDYAVSPFANINRPPISEFQTTHRAWETDQLKKTGRVFSFEKFDPSAYAEYEFNTYLNFDMYNFSAASFLEHGYSKDWAGGEYTSVVMRLPNVPQNDSLLALVTGDTAAEQLEVGISINNHFITSLDVYPGDTNVHFIPIPQSAIDQPEVRLVLDYPEGTPEQAMILKGIVLSQNGYVPEIQADNYSEQIIEGKLSEPVIFGWQTMLSGEASISPKKCGNTKFFFEISDNSGGSIRYYASPIEYDDQKNVCRFSAVTWTDEGLSGDERTLRVFGTERDEKDFFPKVMRKLSGSKPRLVLLADTKSYAISEVGITPMK